MFEPPNTSMFDAAHKTPKIPSKGLNTTPKKASAAASDFSAVTQLVSTLAQVMHSVKMLTTPLKHRAPSPHDSPPDTNSLRDISRYLDYAEKSLCVLDAL